MFSSTRSLVLILTAPAAALLCAATPNHGAQLLYSQSAALHASVDPSLGALRAGRAVAAHGFDAHTRTGLRSAEAQTSSLGAMRAGFEMTDNEWKWLAIGGGVVLLIVLL